MPANTTVEWYNINLPPYSTITPMLTRIQTAINDAHTNPRGGVVYIPSGEYLINGTLVIPDNHVGVNAGNSITLRGDGPTSSVITQTGNVDILNVQGDLSAVEGLMLQGNGSLTAGRGLVIQNTTYSINRVSISGVKVRRTFS